MKKFVDTHCHIFLEYYDDIPRLMNDIAKGNVSLVVNNAVDLKSMKEVLKTSQKYNNMFCSLGIHPEYANDYQADDLYFIEQNIQNEKVVAIGEIGLDYHYDGFDKNKQKELLEKQFEIATQYNLPVIIHSREATADTINILKKHSCKGIIHSFSGSYETALEYIKMGYYLGINGVVTFKNAKLIETIKKIGIGHIVLETDSPYLTPVPFRGEKNNPTHINDVIKFLATNLNLSEDKIVDTTNKNVVHIFDKISPKMI